MKLIKTIWIGNLSLVKTFWLVSFLGSAILSLVSIIIENSYDSMGEIASLFALLFFLFFLVYVIFSYVAVWRSATKYTIVSKKKKKSALWGYVAKAVVVLGIINGSREILIIFL